MVIETMETSLQQLQQQILDLPKSDRRQLVEVILASLQPETTNSSSQNNLSRLRGIAKSHSHSITDEKDDYTDYLIQKYS